MLGADNNGIDPGGDAVAVLNGDLGLAVGPEIRNRALFPHQGQLLNQFLGEANRQRHEFRRLVTGESDHHSLVAGAGGQHGLLSRTSALFESGGDAFADVSGLLLDGDDDAAALGVDPIIGAGVASFGQGVADDLWHVNGGRCRDLAHDDDQSVGHGGLTGHAAHGVVPKNCVQDSVGDLVTELIGVTFGHRLRGQQVFRGFVEKHWHVYISCRRLGRGVALASNSSIRFYVGLGPFLPTVLVLLLGRG